jgi:hypothetical protein
VKPKPIADIHGGRYYGRLTPDGPLVPVTDVVGEPDAWICRRVADYPQQQVPTGGAVATCTKCAAPIAFNPARTIAAPKICMQCAGIRPLPIE